ARERECEVACDVIGQDMQAGGRNPRAGCGATLNLTEHTFNKIVYTDHARIGAALLGALGVPVRRHDYRHGAVRCEEGGSRPKRFEARQHYHRVRLLDEMGAVMHADEKGNLLISHAGTDVGEALLEVHAVVISSARANSEWRI